VPMRLGTNQIQSLDEIIGYTFKGNLDPERLGFQAVDPEKSFDDYTLQDWVTTMFTEAHRLYSNSPRYGERYRKEGPGEGATMIYFSIMIFAKMWREQRLNPHKGPTRVQLRFPDFESFRSNPDRSDPIHERYKYNNFPLFFYTTGTVMGYATSPLVIRFKREHPELYRELSTVITENGYGPGTLPFELEPKLFEAFQIMASYTDLYDPESSGALSG